MNFLHMRLKTTCSNIINFQCKNLPDNFATKNCVINRTQHTGIFTFLKIFTNRVNLLSLYFYFCIYLKNHNKIKSSNVIKS